MFLKRILNFFLGYCVIKVQGSRKERFINLVINAKIPLWDIVQKSENELWVKVYVSDIRKLRHIARKSGCPFKIMAKHGFPFLALRAEKRKGLVAGLMLFLLTFYFFSSFIWFVELSPNQPLVHLSGDQIIAEAARLGLKPGALKAGLSLDKIAQDLAIAFPQLTFVSIELQGTLAKIEVVEKKVVDEDKKERPAHLIAAKDGVIEEILVLAGEPRVGVGDTVQKGQLLISGFIPKKEINQETGEIIEEGLLNVVEAKGIVRARIWYEAVAQAPIIETGKKKTGVRAEQWSLRIGDKTIIIRGPKSSPYANFKEESQSRTFVWRNLNVPVEVVQTIFYELKPYQRNWGREGAINNGKNQATKLLKTKIPADAQILDQKVEVLSQSGNVIKVRVWLETMEDIGQKQYIQPGAD